MSWCPAQTRRPSRRASSPARSCRLALGCVVASIVLLARPADAAFALNHFLGTCLTEDWVASMEAKLGVSSTSRDELKRLEHPFLHAALRHPRYKVNDPRTGLSGIYSPNCMPADTKMYGVGAEVDASGAVTKLGKINNTLVVEMHTWTTHAISSYVYSILASEVYGYEVSIYVISESSDLTERMSSVRSGLCTPVHVNVEVWTTSYQAKLDRYMNESIAAGGIGYLGRSGLYTSVDFIHEMLNTTKYPSGPYYANFWREYEVSEELIQRVPVSSLTSKSAFYNPPGIDACPDGVRGCLRQCSKTAACTKRENEPGNKECLVVTMMYESYDRGYLQAVMANIGIPAYFCFLGYDGATNYIVYAQKNKLPVLFLHWEPDTFHVQYEGLFERVFLPQTVPERVALGTSDFGELGYGKPTTNPVDVDFPYTMVGKYAAALLYNAQQEGPAHSLASKIWIPNLHMNDMMRKYIAVTPSPTQPTPEFQAACQWLKENYNTWRLWLERLPLCTFDTHVHFQAAGCEPSSTAASNTDTTSETETKLRLAAEGMRTITFAWKTPNPSNASLPYMCDGGLTELPQPLQTSRSCAWLLADSSKWVDWIKSKPECDATFYDYSVSRCDSSAKRTVHYYWLLPDPADGTKSLECDASSVPLPNDVLVDCEYLPFSAPLFSAVLVVDAVVIAGHLCLMLFVFVCRKAPIIKRSQYELLLLMLVGGMLVCLSALAYAGEPSDFLCAARPLLVSSGFTTIFGSLFVKSLRVYRVFMRSAMKRVTITMTMMVKVLSVFYIVDALILGVWFSADFPKPTVTVEQAKEFRGSVSRISCVSNSFIFSALLMFWKAIVLFLGIYTSFLIRNVSADFQESIWIFSSSVMVLVGCLVILPLAYLVEMPAAPFYGFLAGSLLICTVVVMSFMLVPKIFRLHATSTSSASSKYSGTASVRNSVSAKTDSNTQLGRAGAYTNHDNSEGESTTTGTTRLGDANANTPSGTANRSSSKADMRVRSGHMVKPTRAAK